MKTEQLKKGNEIQKEIVTLNDYIGQAKREPDKASPHLHTSIVVLDWNGGWRIQTEYGNKAEKCPEFLKEQLQDDIEFIVHRMISKIEKRIKELQTEFEAL